MAGDWIKIESTTPDKPEVFAMAATLSLDPDAVVGKLVRLWAWVDSQSLDGNAVSVTNVTLDRITFCAGFAAALRSVGWMTGDDGLLSFPNFGRHNGKTAKARALTGKRVANHRSESNAASVTNVTHGPLPEKRREEKSLEKKKNAGAGEPCTVEQAREAATQAMIPAELGEEWFHNRASTHWTKTGIGGRDTTIGETNWRSDLVQWCRAVQAGRKDYPKPYATTQRPNGAGRPSRNDGTLNDPSEYREP